MNLTEARGRLGQHDQALRSARECVRLHERLNPGGGNRAAARVCLGKAFLRAGRPGDALASLSVGESAAIDTSAREIFQLEMATYRALSLADLGRDSDARAALRPLVPELLRVDVPWLEARNLRREAALRAARIGMPDEAAELHRAVVEMTRE